ncbi:MULTISPECIES: peptidase T [unclassified Enterococcus]|uniref:peptidase T n=1 Tax=unclassified Enterococcus TaxID=2608891 RepID=UPI001557292B|nr:MULTISPECIES: peptidase T [unclassified Enterococcus]MBS7576529.1 peptidase T [Enterococcus sp. MMGLQ5-2]MBS7583984.1 peptidase T [Enterococcus sp. MMGLQ5-1]NPD11845.1 peptidase T [Enterococcus sp. MMGLQ5-1]NPD36366.1 peptidase T [Enterococcus sp. MMGLQ5-2]
MKYDKLLERFIRYAKIETRSNPESNQVPTTKSQIDFAHLLADELRAIGLADVHYLKSNGYLIATLPSNSSKSLKKIGFIAHMDTADFNAVNVAPQIIEDYQGEIIPLGTSGFELNPAEFPNLMHYIGQTLITTDGTTLLGSDDKSGIAEIITAMAFLISHPEIEHGEIRIGFGPDEEIGVGANLFDVEAFNVDFAYTVDGGPLGELQYETFSAAEATIRIQGKNVHPGTAKDVMINALQIAHDFHAMLPAAEVPEKTEGYQGFYHLLTLSGTVDEAELYYIIRDFTREGLEKRKNKFVQIINQLNEKYGEQRVKLTLQDQYYNMREVIEKDMAPVELAEKAMIRLGIQPIIEPIRGGTDGSKISFLGLPTPNFFAGGENMHGRYEFVSLETMVAATDTIIEIIRLNAE